MVSAHRPQHHCVAENHSRLHDGSSKTMHAGDSQSRSKCLLMSPSSMVRTECQGGTELFKLAEKGFTLW